MASDHELLDTILNLDEGINLDYKARVDLDSVEGKAKFIKVILALANSPIKPSLMVLGVEDKTKNIVGVQEDVSEERLQNIVHTYCKPPVQFSYKRIKSENGVVGVINIIGHRRPYTPREKYLELLTNKQKESISEKTVFIRHGSTTDTAHPEEIMEMEKERYRTDSEALENIALEISDLRSSISNLRWPLVRIEDHFSRDRSIEYAFIGIVSGVILGYLESIGWEYTPLAALVLPIMLGIVFSATKVVRFGLLRSLAVGVLVGTGYELLSQVGRFIPSFLFFESTSMAFLLIWSSVKGLVGGFIAMLFLSRLENGG